MITFADKTSGQEINNPFFSSCGRFPVDPIVEYGFSVVDTGGGCGALEKVLDNGNYIWITHCDGVSLPDINTEDSEILLCLYDQEGEELLSCSLEENTNENIIADFNHQNTEATPIQKIK